MNRRELAKNGMRVIETLSSDLGSANVWSVPEDVSLDEAIRKQDDPKFRSLYFASSRPLTMR